MKFRIELTDTDEPEVIIRCKSITPEISRLADEISKLTPGAEKQIAVFYSGTEFFLSPRDILFFETDGARVCVHTKDRMYYTDHRLYELSELLPRYFVRSSKSCLVNINHISQITRNITSSSEARFYDSDKKIYISRMYYKQLRDEIEEKRLKI